MDDFNPMRDRMMAEARAVENCLPGQISALPGWEEPIAPAIHFVVQLPKLNGSQAFTTDEAIELHWWTSLCVHLTALALGYKRLQDDKARSRCEHASRDALNLVKGVYGREVMGAVSAAAFASANFAMPNDLRPGHELGWWSMAIQTSFGLMATTAMAVGKDHPRVLRLKEVYERVRFGAMGVYCDDSIGDELIRVCTGTETGTLEEALHLMSEQAQQALEGAPEAAHEALAPLVAEDTLHPAQKALETSMGIVEPSFADKEVQAALKSPLLEHYHATVQPMTEELEAEVHAVADEMGVSVEGARMMLDTPGPTQATLDMMEKAEALRPKVHAALERVGLTEAKSPAAIAGRTAELGIGVEKRNRIRRLRLEHPVTTKGEAQEALAKIALAEYWNGFIGRQMSQATVDEMLEIVRPEAREGVGLQVSDNEAFAGASIEDDRLYFHVGPWAHFGRSRMQLCHRCAASVSLGEPQLPMACPEDDEATEDRHGRMMPLKDSEITAIMGKHKGTSMSAVFHDRNEASCGHPAPKPNLEKL